MTTNDKILRAIQAEEDSARAEREGGHRVAMLRPGEPIHAWACPCHTLFVRAEEEVST